MIKIIGSVFILMFSFGIVSAQNAEGMKHIAEVKKQLLVSKKDTNKVLLIVDLCTAYQWSNSDSLDHYSKKGMELAAKLNFPKGEVRILNSKGISLAFLGDIPQALNILFKALRLAEKNNFPLEKAVCLNTIGGCYFFMGDQAKSIDFIKRAQAINETVNHSAKDIYWKIYISFWLGTEYMDANKLDSAEIFFKKAYDNAFAPAYTDLYNIRPTILMYFGQLYSQKGDYEKAFSNLYQAIKTFNQYNDPIGTADASTFIARLFKEKNIPDSVLYYAKKGLDASLKYGYQRGTLNNSKILAEYYEQLEPKQALYYLKIKFAANDSLYGAGKIQELQKTISEEQLHEQQIQEDQLEKQNRLKQNGFLAGLAVLVIIAFILFRNNHQRKKANTVLQLEKAKVESTLSELKSTQAQLIQSEKLASLGELTAGIAHEIQNPLNFVNNFSEVSVEIANELKEEAQKPEIDKELIFDLATDLAQNQEKINHHGKRASSIVKGMLEHSRASTGVKELTDINALADEYLRLAYHGIRAKDNNFNSDYQTDFDENLPKIQVIPQDIGRVLLNLINNAFWAVAFASHSNEYSPKVIVKTSSLSSGEGRGEVCVEIIDNGIGMTDEVKAKIFQPFFTTKPTGEGTGLGLSLAYDIVTKGHGGTLEVVSTEGVGSEFIIQLPIV